MTQGLRVGRAETKNRSGRCSEIERREAIARERGDQQVVCSVRWDAYGRRCAGTPMEGTPMEARRVKERVAAGGVRRALGLNAAGDHLTQFHRRASRRTITVAISGRPTAWAQPHRRKPIEVWMGRHGKRRAGMVAGG